MKTLDELMDMAKKANGRRRTRTIGKSEAREILALVESADSNMHTIRVYSEAGFVPNSYKWRADISYFEATKNNDGEWQIIAKSCDAKRSHASGALVTINGRAQQ